MRATVLVRRGDLVDAETDIRAVADSAAEYGVTFAIPQAMYWGADALIERPGLADLAMLATTTKLGPELAPTMFGAMLSEVRGRARARRLRLPSRPGRAAGCRGHLQCAARV